MRSKTPPMPLDRRAIRIRLAQQDKDQTWLAGQVGITPGHLARVLRGTRPASPELARRIADALFVPLMSLLREPAA